MQARCGEDNKVEHAECNDTDNKCVAGQYLRKGHGVMTGIA